MKRLASGALLAAACVLAAAPAAQAAFAPDLKLTLDPPNASATPALTATVLQDASETPARRLTLLFPAGFALQAPLGVDTCSSAGQAAADCPRSSEIGSLEAALADGGKLAGTVHLAQASSGTGLLVILRGSGELAGQTFPGVAAQRANGAVAVTLDNLPSRLSRSLTLRLIGGSRGLLRTPSTCGRQVVEARMTSHSGELAIGQSAVELAGCRNVRLSRVRLSSSKIRAARSSSLTLSWTQSQATGGTRVFVEHRKGRSWRRTGSIAAAGNQGLNQLRFSGRLRGRRLKAGTYRFALAPRGASQLHSSRFTVLKPR